MYSTSQQFQLLYICRFATFSKARHAVIYGVGSPDDRSTPKVQQHVGACEAGLQKTVVKTCSSCNKISLFGQIINIKLLAHLDLLSNRLALQNGGGVRGGRSHPHLKSMDKDQNALAACNR